MKIYVLSCPAGIVNIFTCKKKAIRWYKKWGVHAPNITDFIALDGKVAVVEYTTPERKNK